MKDTWQIFEDVVNGNSVTNLLLYGPPGTGKTSKACKTVKKGNFFNITLNEESSVSEILGMWIPKGKEFVWSDGVGIRAWKEGKLLVINEIDKASGSVLTQLHAILDDRRMARLTIPSGETVKPKKGFKVIATMNGSVQDLPEALADRFDLKLNISKPHQDLINLLPEDLRELVDSAYSTHTLSISFREILSFSKLRDSLGDDAYTVFGKLGEDVKSVLHLGKRELHKIEESDDIESLPVEDKLLDEELKFDDFDKRLVKYAKRKFKSYWETTEFSDLNEASILMLVGRFKKLTVENLYYISNAFAYQHSDPSKFENLIETLYEEIISIK